MWVGGEGIKTRGKAWYQPPEGHANDAPWTSKMTLSTATIFFRLRLYRWLNGLNDIPLTAVNLATTVEKNEHTSTRELTVLRGYLEGHYWCTCIWLKSGFYTGLENLRAGFIQTYSRKFSCALYFSRFFIKRGITEHCQHGVRRVEHKLVMRRIWPRKKCRLKLE